MLLADKSAVIYGGGGSIGGAVTRAFAREGAAVYLAGRTLAALEKVADEICSAGGAAGRRRSMRSIRRPSRGTWGRSSGRPGVSTSQPIDGGSGCQGSNTTASSERRASVSRQRGR